MSAALSDGNQSMATKTYRKRVPRRIYRDHRGLPQMIVEMSALPEFGGKPCSLTMAYRVCDGSAVSSRLTKVMEAAQRRLREQAA